MATGRTTPAAKMSTTDPFQYLAGEKHTFAMDVADYRSDYHQLLQARGYSDDSLESWVDQPITEASITACLRYFYGDAPIVLLLYFYTGGSLKVWLLNQEGFQFQHESPVREQEFMQLERQLAGGLARTAYVRGKGPQRRKAGRTANWQSRSVGSPEQAVQALSQLLFPPGLSTCLTQLGTEHLIIIPALNIQQIPFAILQPFDDDSLLIDHWSYSFAASIYDIAKLTLRKQTRRSGQVAFEADSLNAATTVLVGNPAFAEQGEWILPALPGAEQEVKAIARQLSIAEEDLLLGPKATLPAVRQRLADAQLLYFATHGVADAGHPLDGSGLFFSPSPGQPEGFWTARAIQQEELSATLVVLSACQTGLGQSQDAGVIGLSRAFHLAGAENIVMSLWSVDDQATSRLMQHFLQKLQEPNKFFPSEPLRQAMLAYRQQYPTHKPVHWAAFATFGIPY
jgi:CHAT domain-containing protein